MEIQLEKGSFKKVSKDSPGSRYYQEHIQGLRQTDEDIELADQFDRHVFQPKILPSLREAERQERQAWIEVGKIVACS